LAVEFQQVAPEPFAQFKYVHQVIFVLLSNNQIQYIFLKKYHSLLFGCNHGHAFRMLQDSHNEYCKFPVKDVQLVIFIFCAIPLA